MAVEHEARVVRIVEHARETRSLFLRQSSGPRIAFRPGQFISCLLPIGGETLIRPYSLASDPEDDDLEICLNLVPGGLGSPWLLGLPCGATLRFTGPWGTFILDRAPDVETVFIADGTGIAPIRPMLHRATAAAARRPLRVLHGAASEDGFLFRDELARLARDRPLLEVAHVASARLRDEVVRRWVDADDDRSRRFFVCGVGSIVPELRDLLRGAGYERRAVQYEKW
jgi:glycine betaine catabolism B